MSHAQYYIREGSKARDEAARDLLTDYFDLGVPARLIHALSDKLAEIIPEFLDEEGVIPKGYRKEDG